MYSAAIMCHLHIHTYINTRFKNELTCTQLLSCVTYIYTHISIPYLRMNWLVLSCYHVSLTYIHTYINTRFKNELTCTQLLSCVTYIYTHISPMLYTCHLDHIYSLHLQQGIKTWVMYMWKAPVRQNGDSP